MNIELKRWSEVEFEAISDIFTRADRTYLSDGLPMPYTAAHVQHWFEHTVREKDGKSGIFRIICVNGVPAGDISVECGQGIYSCDADIGYLLLDEYKGQGVMTEAVHRICREAFASLHILRISARVFAPNAASCRVLEKNNFVPEGCMKNAVCKSGNIYDMLLFGKLK